MALRMGCRRPFQCRARALPAAWVTARYAERERARRNEQASAEQARKSQRLRARALEVLEAVTAAGGRLALNLDYSEREVTQVADCLAREGLLPDGQRLAHEPTRMDPVLGVTAYLEPDFAPVTPLWAFKAPSSFAGLIRL